MVHKINHVIDLDADPFVPSGWKVEEHRKGGHLQWDPAKVALYLPKKQEDGTWIEGNKAPEGVKTQKPIQRQLARLPPRTPATHSQGVEGQVRLLLGNRLPRIARLVRCLSQAGGRWRWVSRWLGDDWYDSYPAAVPAR